MRDRRVTAIGLVALLILSGCSAMQERRWSYCAVAGGLVGAAVGAGTAGGLVNAYEKERSQEHTGAAAGGGAVVPQRKPPPHHHHHRRRRRRRRNTSSSRPTRTSTSTRRR